jgi:hypothetical protein
MKILNVEVKSKDQVLGTINVQEFDDLEEAVSFFVAAETEGDDAAKSSAGYKKALGLINAQHRANVTNAERVRLTRGVSPITALRDAIKTNPAIKASLEALLAQYNLPTNLA